MTAIVAGIARARSGSRTLVMYLGIALPSSAVGAQLVRMGSFQRQLKGLLLGVAMLAAAAVVVTPTLAFPLVVALAPFEFPMRLLGLQAGSNEVLVIGLAVVLVPQLRPRSTPVWASVGFGCLVAGSFVAAAHAAVPGQAVWGALRWLAIGVLALAAFQLLRDAPNATRRAADIVSGTAIVVALFALAQRSGIYAVFGRPYLFDRIDSSFGYYTQFGGYMAIALVVALAGAVDSSSTRQPHRLALHSAAVMFAGIGLGISLSRGALLGAAVGVATLVALNVRNPRRALLLGLALMVGGAAIWLATPASTRLEFSRRLSMPLGSTGSDRAHLALAKMGETALESHPAGIGFGNFPAYMLTAGTFTGRTFAHAHRLPVQIGLDAGWLGLGGFAVLVLTPLGLAIRASARRTLSPTGAGFAAALAVLLAQGWFDYLFYELSFLVVFATLVVATWHGATRGAG